MFEVFDHDLKRIAFLENAFDIEETQRINSIWKLKFTLPSNDFKNKFCLPFNFVRFDRGELYRILPIEYSFGENELNVYDCEHVLATLLDDALIGWHQVGNIGYFTKKVIEYILSHQTVQRWTLKECDFSHQFEYGWEKENLASALFSVATPFADRYIWETNTTVYPWEISLKKMDMNALPKHYLRTGHNIFTLTQKSDPTKICTRLYPYGAGEGINQLVIDKINNGKRYLEAPKEIIDKYGLKVLQWSDRRYTNMESLKSAGQAILDEISEPYVEYNVTNLNVNGKVGEMVKIIDNNRKIDYTNIIVEVHRKYGEIVEEDISIANKPQDVSSSITDLADRQRIEQNYSQGATQHYSVVYSDNADKNNPTELYFYIPEEMLMINAVQLKVKLNKFRAYSKATTTGGSVQTSSSGGGTSTTTSSGGGTSTSTDSGGGTSDTTKSGGSVSKSTSSGGSSNVTSASGGATTSYPTSHGNIGAVTVASDGLEGYHSHQYYFNTPSHTHEAPSHTHMVSIPSHDHDFTIPTHSHSFSVPSHSHRFTVNSHTHSLNIGTHTHTLNTTHNHNITPVIEYFGSANSFAIIINGVQKAIINGYDFEGDITSYLVDGDIIPRDKWHTVGIKPIGGDGLARPHISVHLSGFVQSRGDKTV